MVRILFNSTSATVRLVLRVYFNVVLLLLGLIGDQCCKNRSRLRLLRNRPLEITQTTGWLRGTSAAYAMYSMRRSPAGWLGFVMILAGIFWLVADLVVSGLVVPVNVVDRCLFNITGPYEMATTNYTFGPFSIAPVGTLFDIVTKAQKTSKANGGLTGIFNKTNTDPLFRADAHDIIGRWECQQVGRDSTYPFDASLESMFDDLQTQGLMYQYATACPTSYIGKNAYIQVLGWSSSVGDWADNLTGTPSEIINSPESHPWNVLTAVEMSTDSGKDRIMRSFNCTMNAPTIEHILGKLQGPRTLDSFCMNLKSNIYGYFTDGVPPVPDLSDAIGSTLDTVMMMASAQGAGVNKPGQHPPDPTQGCLAVKTQMPGPVIIVWILVTGATLAIFTYWLLLTLEIRALNKRSTEEAALVTKNTPNGLLDWMKQAVREVEPNKTIELSNLNDWTLATSHEMQGLHLAQKGHLSREEDVLYSDNKMPAVSIQTFSTNSQEAVSLYQEPSTRSPTILRKPVQSQASLIRPRPVPANMTAYAPISSQYHVT
jgi:hypothetical protein